MPPVPLLILGEPLHHPTPPSCEKCDMNELSTLSPIQKDIYLDEKSGSKQNYSVGLHCRIDKEFTPEGINQALEKLESILASYFEPVWCAEKQDKPPFPCYEYFIHTADSDNFIDSLTEPPFDFSQQLLRVYFIHQRDHNELVVLSHHIVMDGESIATLCAEILRIAKSPQTEASSITLHESSESDLLCSGFDNPKVIDYWKENVCVSESIVDELDHSNASDTQLIRSSIRSEQQVSALCRQLRVTEPFLFKCLFGLALSELYSIEGSLLINEVVNYRTSSMRGKLGCYSGITPFILPPPIQTHLALEWFNQAKDSQRNRKGMEKISQFQSSRIGLNQNGIRAIYNFHSYSQQILSGDVALIDSVTSENPRAIQFYLYHDNSTRYVLCSHPQGKAFAKSIIETVNVLLEQLIHDVNQPLCKLNIIGAPDCHTLDALNETDKDFDEVSTLTQLFDLQVKKTPHSVAVADHNAEFTFTELKQRVDAFASYLVRQGVRPGDRVGIFLDRSVHMLIGVLGIVKSGAAYVPLDTDYPDSRLTYIIEDAAISNLVVDKKNCDTAKSWGAVSDDKLFIIDDESMLKVLEEELVQTEALDSRQDSDNTAYVIYTSGSTGNPKGVMLAHKGVVNRLAWMQDYFKLDPNDTILQKTPFGFDVSVWELFWGPIVGVRTFFAKSGGHKDPNYLAEVVEQEQVTTIHFVPSMLQLFLQCENITRSHSLRHIICSGEALGADTYNQAIQLIPQANVINLYGPTEASIDVTCWQGEPGKEYTRIPIGRAIDNTQCHVLSRYKKRLPYGFAGELYLGGVQLAQGYLGKPDLTADKFVSDFIRCEGENRLYRTGDLVRYGLDGNIDYLGRIDDQVKIRGLRIELGEIEQQIIGHSDVSNAVVVAKDDHHGQKILLAYFTSKNDTDEVTIVNDVKAHLKRVLPDYMLPSGYLNVPAIPLSPNGKVNRRALPDFDLAYVEGEYQSPQTETETALCEIWASLLGLEPQQVGRNANFFELGGHSLLLMQVQNEVRSRLNAELSIIDVFKHSTLSVLAKRIDENTKADSQPVITSRYSNKDAYSCKASFSQTRLWFLDQLEGSNSHYNIPATLKVKGRFDLLLAQQILQQLIHRHAPLRTTFFLRDDEVYQQVNASAEIEIHTEDLRSLSADAQMDRLSEHIESDAKASFNLANAPMLRAAFYQHSSDEGWLLINVHHIASDGWSMGILLREFIALYDSMNEPLPPLPLCYGDYANWQHDWVNSSEFDSQVDYWTKQLEGAPQVHQLPLDFERPEAQTFSGADEVFSIDRALVESLRAIGKQHQATLYMVLHAAFVSLLERYSGQGDIVVGTPVANRTQKELEQLVGFFVNSLALRVKCNNNGNFVDLLAQVRQVNVEAQSNKDVPFELLVNRLNPTRSAQYTPVFQIMFSMDTEAFEVQSSSQTDFELVKQPSVSAKFDLLLNAVEKEDGITFTFEYNRDIFKQDTVRLMSECFTLLLEEVADNPYRALGNIDCLPKHEKKRQIESLNQTASTVELNSIYGEILNRVERSGDKVAVVCGSQSLTYRELESQTNRIARLMLSLGVRSGELVGICLPPSVHLASGMLATIKSLAGYVPIDPNYPSERIEYMLRDSKVRTLIGDESTVPLLAEHVDELGLKLINLSDMDQLLDYAEDSLDFPKEEQKDSVLYTIYTSGSTGRPKAAQVNHKGALNLLEWYISQYDRDENNCTLVMSSIAFDLTQKNIWSTLMMGGRLVFNDHKHYDVGVLQTIIATQNVTRVNCAPSAFYPLIDEPETFGLLNSLKQVYLGGESVVVKRLKPWMTQTDCQVINSYGPTECTDVVSSSVIHPEELSAPIGRPIPNTQLYILSPNGQLLPPGCLGELYIGGVGVGPGYLGNPELTEQKFVDDIFSAEQGRKLYRTGDLVRYQNDGQIQYVGRTDDQVKVRGFRVELGEIEQQLTSLDDIESAAVIARYDNEHIQLSAYFTTKKPLKCMQTFIVKIQSHLKGVLPEYMVPSSFLVMEQLPLSPNGKIDRKALQEIMPVLSTPVRNLLPASDTEKQLATIWSELLGVEVQAIGQNSQFFELGGNSILMTQLLARIRKQWGDVTCLSELFEHSTLSDMATLLERSSSPISDSSSLVIPKRSDTKSYPLTDVQKRIWFLSQLNTTDPSFNIFGSYRIEGSVDKVRLERAIRTVVNSHPVLTTRFIAGDEPQQYFSESSSISLKSIKLQPENIDAYKANEANHLFNLTQEPLVRISLLSTPNDVSYLLVNIHHIISDGWTLRLFIDQLRKAYEGEADARQVRFEDIDYCDFADWQSQRLSGEYYQQLENAWRTRFDVPVTPLHLPASKLGQIQSSTSEELTYLLPAEKFKQLTDFASSQSVTPFIAMLSAYATLLHRHSAQDDLVIGMPVAGRQYQQTEQMMGCFINVLPIRLKFKENQSFDEFLQEVKTVCLDALEHQDMPFERIVELANPERQLHRSPLFDVMLNWNEAIEEEIHVGEMTLKEDKVQVASAKYPMTLYVDELKDAANLRWHFQSDVIPSGYVTEMTHQLVSILDQVVVDPMTSLQALSLTTAADNGCERIEQAPLLIEQFTDIVSRLPESPAVMTVEQTFSYKELFDNAKGMAVALEEAGISQGDVVAIAGERSFGFISAMLSVALRGGVMMPLDSSMAQERLENNLTMAQPKLCVWVGSERAPKALTAVKGIQVSANEIAAENKTLGQQPGLNVQFDDSAYIFFTSGTTGRPKGILGRQGSLANFLRWQRTQFNVMPGSRAAHLTGYGFDVVLRDIFLPLTSGGVVCIPPSEVLLSAEPLFKWMRQQKVEYFHTVPSIAKYWLSRQNTDLNLPSLQRVFFAGEPLTVKLIERWQQCVHPSASITNLYGPTETTMAKFSFDYVSKPMHPSILPVGKPIPGTSYKIVNTAGTLCGIGEVGEVQIETPDASKGYIGQGYSHPFVDKTPVFGERWIQYNTGDLGYVDFDGQLNLVGRKDDQIKIRGVRIELAEVQKVIAEYPEVSDAVVLPYANGSEGKELVAYVAIAAGRMDATSVQENILNHARLKLDPAMLPTQVVPLTSLPLTSNGKVDRKALPDPSKFKPKTTQQRLVPPKQGIETELKKIWAKALGHGEFGREDRFFDIGGHSLLLMEVKSDVGSTLGCTLPLVDYFKYPTIATLAQIIEKERDQSKRSTDEKVSTTASSRAELRKLMMRRRRQPDQAI